MGKPNDITLETLPVYKRLKKDLKEVEDSIPTDTEITNLANSAIQADKDVLSQITVEYDEDNDKTIVTFPKDIIPLSFTGLAYGAATAYLGKIDTSGSPYFEVLDQNGSSLYGGKAVVDNSSHKVKYSFSGDKTESVTITNLSYILGNNINISNLVSSYYIYKPITSSGTKLYKHDITIKSAVAYQRISFISNNNKSLLDATGADTYILVSAISFNTYATGANAFNGFSCVKNIYGGTVSGIKCIDYSTGDVISYTLEKENIDTDNVTEL